MLPIKPNSSVSQSIASSIPRHSKTAFSLAAMATVLTVYGIYRRYRYDETSAHKNCHERLINDLLEYREKALKAPDLQGCNGLLFFESKGRRIFAVHKDDQAKLSFPDVKAAILERCQLVQSSSILQVVGDSAPYSKEGTEFAKKFLVPFLNENGVILWGFTGHSKDGGSRLDVNQIVNEWIDEAPLRGKRVLANIVDGHTLEALQKWGCRGTNKAQNFYLVCGNAKFGDDVISSDSITDKAVCLEGGIQSFKQIVNFLAKGVHIHGVTGLRWKENPINFDEKTNDYILYFSAVEFLSFLFQHIERLERDSIEVTEKEVESFKDQYLSERHLFDPRRPDGGTKQALFDSAWKQFKSEKLWTKSNLCHLTSRTLKGVHLSRL